MQTNENFDGGNFAPQQSQNNSKNKNWLSRVWNYFSTYEKLWLLMLWSVGIALSVIFPEIEDVPENLVTLAIVLSVITLMGGCSCELLLSKQSKWAFIVSFFFYDLTFTSVCLISGRYVTALIEFLFWMPMLFVSFFSWEKRKDEENKLKTVVKKINFHKELAIFFSVLAASIGLGFAFTFVEGMTDLWYLDALAATFNVCNGLFLWLRYREQWLAWYSVIACETIFYIISHNWALLVLEVGYLTNTTYGLIKWNRYANTHPQQTENKKQISKNQA